MTKFEGFKHNLSAEDQSPTTEDSTPDRFELLSAYIDEELSASEKKQVQIWLDRDPEFKQLYVRLLALQGKIQHSLAPPSNKSIDEITTGVFQSIDRKRHWRRKLVWGGAAIAASCFATVSGIIPGNTPFSSQMAEVKSPTPASTPVMLAVAIHRPAIDIPKSVTGYPKQNLDTEQK